jgi:hypothetical protein
VTVAGVTAAATIDEIGLTDSDVMLDRDPKMRRIGRIASWTATVALAVGCGSAIPPASTAPATSNAPASAFLAASPSPRPSDGSVAPVVDRAAGVRADLAAMLDARDTIHPDGWHGMARTDWIAAGEAVVAKAATLTDDQLLVELVRLAAMPSWKGRDGHSGIFLTPGSGVHPYPVRFWGFSDGLVITAARAPNEGLVGSKVTAIGGHPIDEVIRLVVPL